MKIWFYRIILFLILLAFGFFFTYLLAEATKDLKPPTQDYIVLSLFPIYLLVSAGVASLLPRKYFDVDFKFWVRQVFYAFIYILAGTALSVTYLLVGTFLQIEIPFINCGFVNILPGPSCIPSSNSIPILAIVFSVLLWFVSFVIPDKLKIWFLRIVFFLAFLPLTLILFMHLYYFMESVGAVTFCANYPMDFEEHCVLSTLGMFVKAVLFGLTVLAIPGLISIKLNKKK